MDIDNRIDSIPIGEMLWSGFGLVVYGRNGHLWNSRQQKGPLREKTSGAGLFDGACQAAMLRA
jgi:hypothetical protein